MCIRPVRKGTRPDREPLPILEACIHTKRRKYESRNNHKLRGQGGFLARLALVFIVIASGAGMSLMTSALPAQADNGNQVRLDSVTFVNDEIQDYTNQRLEVEWSIPDQAQPPVTLTVPLPEELRGNADRFPLNEPDGDVLGECTVSAEAVTCEVDDDNITNNPYEVSGSFFFNAQSQLLNKETVEHTYTFGDVEQTVTVTPSSNWCDVYCEFGGSSGWKSGWYNNLTDETIFSVYVEAPEQGLVPGQFVRVTDMLNTDLYELVDDGTYPRVLEADSVIYNMWGSEN